MFSKRTFYTFVATLLLANSVLCAPDSQGYTDESEAFPGFDVEYTRYLNEVSSVLNEDEAFQKSVDETGSKAQKDIGKHFEKTSDLTRTKLDELKRIELRRLRDLHKKSMQLAAEKQREAVKAGRAPNRKAFPKPDLDHVDAKNPHSFGSKDISKLIRKTTGMLANLDGRRKDSFKRHRLDKAVRYKSKFRDLPPEEQQKKLADHLQMAKKHERINHPGNLEQLKEVWAKQDSMRGTEFNPKTFFMLRDIDGDGLLNPAEIEALFNFELDKVYREPGVDQVERDEDMNRMREHVFVEVDTDRDGMISWSEFLVSTKSEEFTKNGDWQSVKDTEQFTDEELAQFEKAAPVKDS